MAYPSLFDQAKIGNVYMASNQAVVTLSALSTTATGLILINPPGSGKNLHLLTAIWVPTYALAAASEVGIATAGVSNAAQPAGSFAVQPAKLGNTTSSGNSVAAVSTSCTTVGATPVFLRMLMGGGASLGTSGQENYAIARDDVDGAIILPPGSSIQLAYVTTANTGLGSFVWMELGL